MASVTGHFGLSPTDKISWLETEKIAKNINSKAGLVSRKIDHFQARIENQFIERVMMGRIKKAVKLFDNEATAYNYLHEMRHDFDTGKKGIFSILPSISAENFLDGEIWEADDVSDTYDSHAGRKDKPLLLYVTGGGFILPSSPKQARMVRRLARVCGCNAVLGKHRLAPENPFPAACLDIADQYETLLKTLPPSKIIVGAETAGASVLLGALQISRDRQQPLPAGVLLFSPWCDLSLSGWSYVTRSVSSASPFRMESAAFCARLYLENELATNPLASPIFADFDGFPKLCIHTSKYDMHFDDALKLTENAHKASVYVKMNYWDTPRHHLERLKSKDAVNSFALAAKFVDHCVRG